MERYVAICHPVKARVASSAGLQRSVKLVIVIWILAAICSIPIVVQYGVVYMQVAYQYQFFMLSLLDYFIASFSLLVFLDVCVYFK